MNSTKRTFHEVGAKDNDDGEAGEEHDEGLEAKQSLGNKQRVDVHIVETCDGGEAELVAEQGMGEAQHTKYEVEA